MFIENENIYFDSKDEGENYIQQIQEQIESISNSYFKILWEYVDYDKEEFMKHIKNKFPNIITEAIIWIFRQSTLSL